MANPKGRPKVENKWAWIVSESGVIPVEVRKHQGVYKTFMYDTEKQRTSFLREVKTPVFNSLEEANKNAPTFEGFKEDYLGVKEGGPRFYESKYGYELSPDMKLSIVEYRFNPASGGRKEGYRRYKYNDAGQATLGKLAPGELFDSPQQGIDDWNSNYSKGKLIDWQAFDDAQADLAAREPTPEQVDAYYQRDMPTIDDFDDDPGMEGFDDTKYKDRNDFNNNENIKNQVDAPSKVQNYSMKGLDFLGKAVAPIDEALEIGIPKLLANTAAAPFAQNLVKVFRQLTLVNLGIAATKGLYESEVMGENYQNLLKDPNNPEYIAERDRLNQEGIQAFSEHMSTYDPSIRFIDKFTEEKLGFNQTDVATKVYGGVKNLFRGGRK
jgi:hypothetical protein